MQDERNTPRDDEVEARREAKSEDVDKLAREDDDEVEAHRFRPHAPAEGPRPTPSE